MKKLLYLLFLPLILSSCVVVHDYRYIAKSEDEYKNTDLMKLKLKLYGDSDEKYNSEKKDYTFSVFFENVKSKANPQDSKTTMELTMSTGIKSYELDSTLYMKLDDKIYTLKAEKYGYKEYTHASSTTTETKTDSGTKTEYKMRQGDYQLMNLKFDISENLAYRIIMSKKIAFRTYLGHEVINIRLLPLDMQKMKEFFGYSLSS